VNGATRPGRGKLGRDEAYRGSAGCDRARRGATGRDEVRPGATGCDRARRGARGGTVCRRGGGEVVRETHGRETYHHTGGANAMDTRWQSERNVANNEEANICHHQYAPPSTHENECAFSSTAALRPSYTLPCKHRLTSIIREQFSCLHATKRFQHRIKAQNARFLALHSW
jgi:hypothetical protein